MSYDVRYIIFPPVVMILWGLLVLSLPYMQLGDIATLCSTVGKNTWNAIQCCWRPKFIAGTHPVMNLFITSHTGCSEFSNDEHLVCFLISLDIHCIISRCEAQSSKLDEGTSFPGPIRKSYGAWERGYS